MDAIDLRRVVTAVDFHESSREAALWAMRHLAPGARHELLHVVDVPELPGPLRGLGGSHEQLRLSARQGALERLEALRAEARSPDAGVHVREGRPAAEIVRLARELGAGLIVVGEQGPRRGVGALLGSTAERVLLESPIPVLVARKVEDAPPRRLLAAIDPSEVCGAILEWTERLRSLSDGTATVLNVVDRRLLVDELTGLPSAAALQRLQDEATGAMRAWVEERVREAGLPGSRAAAKVATGDPSYEIVAEAAREGTDLVVIGSKGGDVAPTPLIGRIVNRVVRSAPCSVLVVVNPVPGGGSGGR